MPYISNKYSERDRLADGDYIPVVVGDLNFVLTAKCLDYIAYTGKSYDTFNAVIGALECAKLEMYRRMIAPYEDKKIEENGDVYP